MNNKEKKSLSERVLERIKSGEVSMKSKTYFVLKGAFIVLALAISTLFLLYIASFVIFSMRISGVWFAPAFGFQGLGVLISSLPWLLIAGALILLGMVEILVRYFSFGYRKPVVYTLIIALAFVSLGSLFFNKAGVHNYLFSHTEKKNTPVMRHLYKKYEVDQKGFLHRGAVTKLTENGFVLEKPGGNKFNVKVSSSTKTHCIDNISKGDALVVLGESKKDIIRSEAIKEIGRRMHFPYRDNNHMPHQPGKHR